MNIGQAEYLKQIGGAAGARVVVHPQGTMPHPEEHGVLAEPGKLTSIAVTKVKMSAILLVVSYHTQHLHSFLS